MQNTKKLTLAGALVALAVVFSTFYIPIGVAKAFPLQHLVNVFAGVFLGPVYAVLMAFATSVIRVLMGTGSLLAFPGSMFGALFCGLLYKHTKSTTMAFLGEVFGTGIIGALVAFPLATLFLSKTVALFAFIIPFGLSSLVGATISMMFIVTMKRIGMFNKLIFEGK